MRKITILAVILLFLVSFTSSGCIESGENDIETMIVTDMAGRDVEIPENVESIVAVGSGCLRLIAYMNSTDLLAGVEEYEITGGLMGRPYALANPQLSELPSIGPIHGGDMELIVDQEPDLIFRADSAEEADEYQEQTGIPAINLAIGDLGENRDGFYGSLRLIGEILDKEARADEIIEYIDSNIQDLRDRTDDISSENKSKVYVGGVLHRGAHDLRSTYSDYAPFEFVNADNVAGGLGSDHAMVDEEAILKWDPDIIFVDMGSYTRDTIDLDKLVYEELKAFQNGDLYGILPYNWHHINYGTVLASSFYVGSVIYSEEFSDIDLVEKADEIYEMLVGEPVYEYMERDLGGFIELEP